ncbi:MAG: DUF1576 domain-containing protein [Firmicutes bacterium]|nr:DUF1576 domain-containing protein [Bacillota bacterium]
MTQKLQKIIKKFSLPILFIAAFIFAFSLEPISDILSKYRQILMSSSVLLSDYLYIGGLSATLVNVLLTTGLNLIIIKALKVKMNGAIFACILTIAGFAFFGKNLYNALPLHIGIFLYCKVSKTQCKDHILVFLLSSGISPITSFLIFGAGFKLVYGIILGVVVGIIVGFILPAFNTFSMKFHQGYNLYNTGFSMGVISMILTGVLASFGVEIYRSSELNNSYHYELFLTIILISLLFIIFAFVENRKVLQRYPSIFKSSGRLYSDFSATFGKDVTLLNIGFMGLIISCLIYIMGIQINGPVMGAVLTVIGFSAFGKHPLNTIPVILGAILAIELTPLEWTIGSSLSVIFVTGLAPIAGQFGIIAGIIAGFIHLMITPLALDFQGGFDLYNNGFAAGFVSALLAPIYSVIFKSRDDYIKWNPILPLKVVEK